MADERIDRDMRSNPKPSPEGLVGHRGERADLKELTIEMGRADIYISLAKHMDLADGHVLFEAILTDDNGSRLIYIDKDDIAACLRESMILGGAPEETK